MHLHGLGLDLTGWFQVLWSADLPQGQVRPLRYFGRDLVAYRDRRGTVRIHDRYCQHLGASLAHGGEVTEEGIRCPFHGWVWGPDGRNVSIPYQDRPNRSRGLRTWTVRELNESVYVWHDPQGREPMWEVPDALSLTPHAAAATFHPAAEAGRAHFTGLRVHPQMVAENAVDAEHFRFVHRTQVAPVLIEEVVDGPTWWARVGFGRRWAARVAEGTAPPRDDETLNTIEILWSGLGVSTNTEHTADGIRVIAINTTPVEDGRSELFATYWLDSSEGDLEDGSYRRRLDQAKAAVLDDLLIWDNQVFLDPPTLATVEGRGFRRIRRWAMQFYQPGADGLVHNGPGAATASSQGDTEEVRPG